MNKWLGILIVAIVFVAVVIVTDAHFNVSAGIFTKTLTVTLQ